ncbi:hypothetical protein DKX38_012613 [Salix brachista]|uniref:Uncharacterized protein n=1 Tax=Salix brachista TaxID=2182728 RepID=A0A5N5LQZ5_9ROSI|nr:hypothetical protein DKX38_012613 [Salix brachista]
MKSTKKNGIHSSHAPPHFTCEKKISIHQLRKLPIGIKPATLDSLQAMKDFKNIHKLNEELLAPTRKPSNDSG